MPGTKRKASFAFSYETPSKLTKRSTSSKVARGLTINRPPLESRFAPLKFPSLRADKSPKMSDTTPSVSDAEASIPSLRKASTITLDSDQDASAMSAKSVSKSLSSKSSSKRPVSLTKKSSSFVEVGALVSKLSGLKSGSIVGETSLATTPSLSRKSSSSKKSPIPSGLTKFVLTKPGSRGSLHVSKSQLIGDVDENEMSSALASLKSSLSKSRSIASVSSAKSASVRSIKDTSNDDSDDVEENNMEMADENPVTSLLPPGGLMEVAISFDTTGSMYGCLEEVRAKVSDLVQRLQADIPGIRVAIIAHGDYCDASNYIVKWIDFGSSLPEICKFVKNVGATFGGDGPECYELVLLRAREALSWTPGSQRALIMINDDVPHEPGYRYGGKTYHINWRDECAALSKMGVKVYGVQSGNDLRSKAFNSQMAALTGGKHLTLEDFNSIFDFIVMICYREANPDMIPIYEQEMRERDKRRGIAKDAEAVAKTLGTLADPFSSMAPAAALPSPLTSKVPKRAAKKPTTTKTRPTGKATVKKVHVAGAKGTKAKTTSAANKKATAKGKHRQRKVDQVLKRESVQDAKLSIGKLKTLTWSKWVCAISPVGLITKGKTKKTKDTGTVSCRHYPGLRQKYIFGNKTRTPAIYEFAVQAPGAKAGKKHVMYFRKSTGYSPNKSWEGYLFRNKLVRKEVNQCVSDGCSVWVRQGTAKGRGIAAQQKKIVEAALRIKTTFDYAWKKYIWRKVDKKMYHRQVKITRRGASPIVISHGDL